MKKPVRIVSALLTVDAHTRLKKLITPAFKDVFLHHCTLAFSPNEKTMEKLLSVVKDKETINLFCDFCFTFEGVQAITCTPKTKSDIVIPSTNIHTHITVSTDGKPPRASNDMLATDNRILYTEGHVQGLDSLTVDAIIHYES